MTAGLATILEHPLTLATAGALMDATSRAVGRVSAARRYRMADRIGEVVWRASPRRRMVIRCNYATMLRTSPADPRVEALGRQSVRNYVRMALDFLVVRTLGEDAVLALAKPVGEEHLADALEGRRGVIFALPHVGNWDIAAAFAQAYGCPLTIVTEGNWAAKLVAGSRTQRGVTLVPRDGSLRPLFSALARNEAVVMLSDLARPDLQVLEVPFFGYPAPFPIGPARLSQRTGAPILVVASTRQPDGTFRVEAQPPLRANPGRSRTEAVAELTARVVAGFERFIAAYPDQWYPFRPVWTGDRDSGDGIRYSGVRDRRRGSGIGIGRDGPSSVVVRQAAGRSGARRRSRSSAPQAHHER